MMKEVKARRDARDGGYGHGQPGRSGRSWLGGRGDNGGKSAMGRKVRGGCLVIVQKKRRLQIHEIGDSGIPNCKSRWEGSGQIGTVQ